MFLLLLLMPLLKFYVFSIDKQLSATWNNSLNVIKCALIGICIEHAWAMGWIEQKKKFFAFFSCGKVRNIQQILQLDRYPCFNLLFLSFCCWCWCLVRNFNVLIFNFLFALPSLPLFSLTRSFFIKKFQKHKRMPVVYVVRCCKNTHTTKNGLNLNKR